MSKKYSKDQKIAYYKKMALVGKGEYKKKYLPAPKKRPPPMKLTGRGGYGQKVGSYLGGLAGGALGGLAETAIKSLAGYGSYSVAKNSVWDEMRGQDPPVVANRGSNGDVIIRHREYLGDVITSSTPGAFKVEAYPINPGMAQTFPWLNRISQQFEQYEFQGLVFEFKTMSADALNSTNTALGTVIMATEYNSVNPDFANKQQMENHEFASSCKPSISALHPIECARNQTTLDLQYVRNGAVPLGADIRMYDLGKFQIATVGFQAASVNIGELWVTYQVRFKKPCVPELPGSTNYVLSDHFKLTGVIDGVTTALGSTTTIPVPGSTLGCVVSEGRQLNFPDSISSGSYLVYLSVFGTAREVVYGGLAGLYNITQNAIFHNDVYNNDTNTGTDSALFIVVLAITVFGPGAYIRFGGSSVYPTAATLGDLFVVPYNSAITT